MHRSALNRTPIALAALLVILSGPAALAQGSPASSDLVNEVLSADMAGAQRQDRLAPEDYVFEWVGPRLASVRLRIENQSIEWVRVAEVLAIPRARLYFSIPNVDGGNIRNAGFSQPLNISSSRLGDAELPVALVSGDSNLIHITAFSGGKKLEGTLRIRFAPKDPAKSLVFVDSSCSHYGVSPIRSGLENSWAYVGCRYVFGKGERTGAATLELYLFWDGAGQSIVINGVETASTSPSLWPIRLRRAPGHLKFESAAGHFETDYQIGAEAHHGFLGGVIGPADYRISDGLHPASQAVVPNLKVYGGYLFSNTLKVYTLDYVLLHQHYYADAGLYLMSEDLKFFDQRVALRLIFGAHILEFKPNLVTYHNFNANQGAELEWADFGKRGYDLKFGGFIYPSIQGQYFLSTWVRWGSPRFYTEFSYNNWTEPLGDLGTEASQTSATISVGFPFAAFF